MRVRTRAGLLVGQFLGGDPGGVWYMAKTVPAEVPRAYIRDQAPSPCRLFVGVELCINRGLPVPTAGYRITRKRGVVRGATHRFTSTPSTLSRRRSVPHRRCHHCRPPSWSSSP